MLLKLTSGRETKNLLGISAEDLEDLVRDLKFNYLRSKPFTLEAEKKGEILSIPCKPMNIHKDYAAIIVPNPELSENGIVWGNQIWAGECIPGFYFKTHKAGELIVEWLYEIRLMK